MPTKYNHPKCCRQGCANPATMIDPETGWAYCDWDGQKMLRKYNGTNGMNRIKYLPKLMGKKLVEWRERVFGFGFGKGEKIDAEKGE